MKNYLILILMSLFLMGCDTLQKQKEKETITVIKNVFVEVPSELLVRPAVTVPPEVSVYKTLPQITKEYTLTMYATNLMQDVAMCHQQIDKISDWNTKQLIIFQSKAKGVNDDAAKRDSPGN